MNHKKQQLLDILCLFPRERWVWGDNDVRGLAMSWNAGQESPLISDSLEVLFNEVVNDSEQHNENPATNIRDPEKNVNFEHREASHENPLFKPPHLWTAKEIMSTDFGEEDWLVDGLIPFPSITALSGNPGNFKTYTTMTLAHSVAAGAPFLGKFHVRQEAVLIVDEEDHIRYIKKRFLQLNISEKLPIFYLSQEGIKIDDQKYFDHLLGVVQERNVKLIILDSLVRIHDQEENDARPMAFVMGQFQKLTKEGVSVLFTHHHRKQAAWGPNNPSQSLRGSSDILAAVDCHLTIEKKKDDDILIIRQEKLRQAPATPPFEVAIEKNGEGMRFSYVGPRDEKKTKAEEAKEAILQILEEESQLFREAFHERLKIAGKQAIDNALKELLAAGAIELVPREELPPEDRKKNAYRLASQFPTPIGNQESGKEEIRSPEG